ncbi:hypothetical protein ACKUVQ_16910 [Mycobacterium seoulense]
MSNVGIAGSADIAFAAGSSGSCEPGQLAVDDAHHLNSTMCVN